MVYFACATLVHVALLVLASFVGGSFIWLALFYITLFTAALDKFLPFVLPQMPEGTEFPTGANLSVLLGGLHFALLTLGVVSLSWFEHDLLEKLVLFTSFALFFGQVSHPNAHELIHRKERYARRLGRSVFQIRKRRAWPEVRVVYFLHAHIRQKRAVQFSGLLQPLHHVRHRSILRLDIHNASKTKQSHRA